MSDRKLASWLDAGLIDEATRDRILLYENEHSRPVALWAVIGIGALAIGLGVISVVAANWEDVPGTVRLAIHLILLAALAGFVAWRGDALESEHPWGLEAALFVLAMLGMTFFGHIGQVYQTSSPLWQPLAVWLALFAPLLLSRGRSWLIAALVYAGFTYACWDYAASFDGFPFRDDIPPIGIAFVTALPVLIAALGAWMRGRSRRATFWKRLEQMALVYAVGGASLIVIFAGFEDFGSSASPIGAASQFTRAAVAVASGALILIVRPSRSGKASAMALGLAALAIVLALPLSGNDLLAGLLFMGLWVGIAAAALQAGWRGVFQIAVAAVAIRLIVLSFELASDLLTSGAGLIASGLMILGVAWIAVRVSRRFAPAKEVRG